MTAHHSVRQLVMTVSGARYALWCELGQTESGGEGGGRWWMRHMPPPDRHKDPLAGAWRPIGTPMPWPPVLGEQLWFRLLRGSLEPQRHERWRKTSPVVAVESWDGDSAWPGVPPVGRSGEGNRQ